MKSGYFFLIFSLILFSVSCKRVTQGDESLVFKYNESAGIASLDPAFARNLEIMWAVNQLYDGLVELDANMQVVPLIAKNWDILDSGRTYQFHLRPDVHFHDHNLFKDSVGRKVVAADFVFSFNRIVSPEVASPGKWIFSMVNFEKQGGFEAPNDSTFLVHLREAFPPFLGMMTMQYCNVVPKEVESHYGSDFRSNPVGSGPFKFGFWLENIALVFHKNESFWQKDPDGRALPYLDAVKIDFVRDMSSEFLGLLKGEYDFMSGIHQAYKDELLDPMGNLRPAYNSTIRFQKTPFLKTDYLGILVDTGLTITKNSMLRDKSVRQALNYAIDRKEMVRYLRNNAVYPASNGFIPRGLPSYNESARYGYDHNPERAKLLLREAGYDLSNVGEISVATTSDYVDLCEFIQHEWKDIGIDLSIDVLPGSSHREQVGQSKLMMFRKSWLADYADGENFLGLFYSENFCPSGPNYTHFSNASFDNLFEAARKTQSDSLRYKLYQQMDSIVMDEAPIIPLFYDQVSHFVRKEVKGLQTNPINMLDLKTVVKR